MKDHEMGQRAIVVAQVDAAHASATLLLELLGEQEGLPTSAVPHLRAMVANLAAAVALLGVEFEDTPAEDTPAEDTPAAGGCPLCKAPAARQHDMSGMGKEPGTSMMCLDCGEGYSRG